jgi:hypothetical protein
MFSSNPCKMQLPIESHNSDTSSILEPMQRLEPISMWPKLDTSGLGNMSPSKIIAPEEARRRLNSITSDHHLSAFPEEQDYFSSYDHGSDLID